jgi:outer membrane PBP1 activator LpoA protein
MIFIVADAQAGRLLTPQLRFFSAGDIPTYATSAIFDPGNSTRDNDLNGIIFTDAPLLLAPDESATSLQRELQAYWPQRTGQLRLYGLGFDAYQLVGSLYGDSRSAWPMRGMSGDLTLDGQGRVRRNLPLAQFRNGRPVALAPTAPRPASSDLLGRR